jgi:hypothetical protein
MSDALRPTAKFCPPKESTPEQAMRVVKKALRDHPENLHVEFVFFAHLALMKAWPCGAGQ